MGFPHPLRERCPASGKEPPGRSGAVNHRLSFYLGCGGGGAGPLGGLGAGRAAGGLYAKSGTKDGAGPGPSPAGRVPAGGARGRTEPADRKSGEEGRREERGGRRQTGGSRERRGTAE